MIFDKITIPALIFFMVTSFVNPWSQGFYSSFIGAMLGSGLLLVLAGLSHVITGRFGMGGGDIKFSAVLGAFLGWRDLFVCITVAFGLGALISLVLILLKKRGRKDFIPFGPFLAAGAFVALLGRSDITF